MGCEIERKFLLKDDSWKNSVSEKFHIVQGYARPDGALATVRFRVVDGKRGFLTLKGHAKALCRSEYEYPVPAQDAEAMIREFCENAIVEKNRFIVPAGPYRWEIDEFLGANAGLTVAEIELDFPDAAFDRPSWLGDEVTGDPRYGNGFLSARPYRSWKK